VSLVRTGLIEVPVGARPGFDHADTYRSGRRMYVAHTGADRVEVLDCEQRTFSHSLPDLPGVAGVLIDEQGDLLFTSDRAASRVSVFRCSDEQLLGQVEVGPHPNGLAYDSKRRRLYSFNLGEPLGENCTASIVDLDTMAVVGELELPGRPRNRGRFLYQNKGEATTHRASRSVTQSSTQQVRDRRSAGRRHAKAYPTTRFPMV
jgi:DNA-binding beta-propeller fold protein YncE